MQGAQHILGPFGVDCDLRRWGLKLAERGGKSGKKPVRRSSWPVREPCLHGSVRFDKRRKTWNYLWYEAGKRRSRLIGTKQDYPNKAAAWKAVERVQVKPSAVGETVSDVIACYETERMPSRHSTARVYRSFLSNHILPKWGETHISEMQPRPVELWLRSLSLSPKSKTHVRSLLHSIVEFAMWSGLLDITRNPISLVQQQGSDAANSEGT